MSKKFKLDFLATAKQKVIEKQKSEKPKKQSIVDKVNKRESIQNQIDKLMSKINDTNQNIKKSEKVIDADVFLKKQKQKTLEYSKNLNVVYEKQKKNRQEKLYKKFNRQKNQEKPLSTGISKSVIPLNIMKIFDPSQIKKNRINKWILSGHYHTLFSLQEKQQTKELLKKKLILESEQQFLLSKVQNKFKRAEQLCSNSLEIKFLPVQVNSHQLETSEFGQNLISILSLMSKELSEKLYLQHEIQEGKIFLCKFYPQGEKKLVITNQFFQVRQFVHTFINIGSKSHDRDEMWPTLIEKCFKKLTLYYPITTFPQISQCIYGLDPQIIDISNKNIIKQNFTKTLISLLQKSKSLIGFMNDNHNENIPTQKIFPLKFIDLKIKEKPKKKKKKKQQKQEQKQNEQSEYEFRILNPYRGFIIDSEYKTKFNLLQILQLFNKIVIVNNYPPKWSCIRIKAQFFSHGPVSVSSSDWTKNNQYSFTLTKGCNMRIALRRIGNNQSVVDEGQSGLFGYMLFKSTEGQTHISCLKLDSLVHKLKSTDQKGCVYTSYIEKGTYIILPFSSKISKTSYQFFNLDLFVEKQQALTINKSRLLQFFYNNISEISQKTIQKLEHKQKFQKPKNEKIEIPSIHSAYDTIRMEQLQKMNLTLMKDVKIDDYFIPGKIGNLLINRQIVVQTKKKPLNSKKIQKNQPSQEQNWERQEALKTILGYDLLYGEQINQGRMNEIVKNTEDSVDLANFGLGEEGINAIIDPLLSMPRITSINVSGNNLNDASIIYLCYFLEKDNRVQLRNLDVSDNNFGKNGVQSLKGLKRRFKNLDIFGLK